MLKQSFIYLRLIPTTPSKAALNNQKAAGTGTSAGAVINDRLK